jgi:hypothetical protein
MTKPRFRPIQVTRSRRQAARRDRVPIRIGDVHMTDAGRVGLDRFVLDEERGVLVDLLEHLVFLRPAKCF